MRKIDDDELLRLVDAGTPQKDIAAAMGVSPAAISKRLRKLQAQAARPAILDQLTPQQERFVVELAGGASQSAAAMSAYNCGSLDSAKSLGSKLAKDPVIQEAITAVMETEGLTREVLVSRLKDHVVQNKDPRVSLSAVRTGLELHDAFPATKNLNMNLNVECSPVDLSRYRNR